MLSNAALCLRGLLLAALLGLLGIASPAAAQDLHPVPVLSGRVIDQTGTLSAAQHSALEAKLAAFEREAGSQLVVLIVPGTQPEDIAAYAQRVGEAWKIGRRDVGDGLLIVVAKDERRMRIEVAKTLEGAVPDLAARQIIDTIMKPAFRKGLVAPGIVAVVTLLTLAVGGPYWALGVLAVGALIEAEKNMPLVVRRCLRASMRCLGRL